MRIESDAAGPLFRAAAGLGPDLDTAEHPGLLPGGPSAPDQALRLGQVASLGGAGPLVRELLRELLTDMTGAYQYEGPQVLLCPQSESIVVPSFCFQDA